MVESPAVDFLARFCWTNSDAGPRVSEDLSDYAAACRRTEVGVLGAVASFHPIDAETLDLTCWLGLAESPGTWLTYSEFGVLIATRSLQAPCDTSYILVSGGLDIELPAGRPGHLVGMCGRLVSRKSTALIRIDNEVYSEIKHQSGGYFCLPVLLEGPDRGDRFDLTIEDDVSET